MRRLCTRQREGGIPRECRAGHEANSPDRLPAAWLRVGTHGATLSTTALIPEQTKNRRDPGCPGASPTMICLDSSQTRSKFPLINSGCRTI